MLAGLTTHTFCGVNFILVIWMRREKAIRVAIRLDCKTSLRKTQSYERMFILYHDSFWSWVKRNSQIELIQRHISFLYFFHMLKK